MVRKGRFGKVEVEMVEVISDVRVGLPHHHVSNSNNDNGSTSSIARSHCLNNEFN